MKKVVINACFGGFGLSHKAVMRYAEIQGFALYPWLDSIARRVYGDRAIIGSKDIIHHYSRVPLEGLPVDGYGDPQLPSGAYFSEYDAMARDDPALIQTIEELGSEANGQCARLKIVEIPDDVEYEIEDHDGNEHIAEKHRTWE